MSTTETKGMSTVTLAAVAMGIITIMSTDIPAAAGTTTDMSTARNRERRL